MPIFFPMSFNMGADGVNNTVEDNPSISMEFLPDSIESIVSNRKFIIYDYGHHGKKWCLIYEDGDSYNFKIGSTRNELTNPIPQIDTAGIMDSYRNLISWGMDTLPYVTKDMARQYPEQWSTFYSSLSVFDLQSECVFNSNNAIGFEGKDNMVINERFSKLCYLMYWLSAPEIRHKLPGFDDYTKSENIPNNSQ